MNDENTKIKMRLQEEIQTLNNDTTRIFKQKKGIEEGLRNECKSTEDCSAVGRVDSTSRTIKRKETELRKKKIKRKYEYKPKYFIKITT